MNATVAHKMTCGERHTQRASTQGQAARNCHQPSGNQETEVRKFLNGLLNMLIVIPAIIVASGGGLVTMFATVMGFLHFMALLGWKLDQTGPLPLILLAVAGIGYITFEQLPPRPQDTSLIRYSLAWLVTHIAGTVIFSSAIVGLGIFLINVTHGVRLFEIGSIHNDTPLRSSAAFTAFS
jgi:hypothetical protein